MKKGGVWGIDLGGTKIEGVVLENVQQAGILCRHRIATERELGYEHILERVGTLVDEMKRRTGLEPKAIGFGTPGALDTKLGGIKNSNTVCLNARPLKSDLEKVLKVDCLLANDANCFALAESTLGAARSSEVVFGVILGTGVGGGIVVNGRVLNGQQGIAGEWGHNILELEGEQCYCGKRGCVEQVISGPALEKFYFQRSKMQRKLHEIAELARANRDQAAAQTIDRLCEWFGRAIATVINILDPHTIVLGGGVSNIDELYSKGLEAAKVYVFNNTMETRIVKHSLGDSAGVFGAAMLTADTGTR